MVFEAQVSEEIVEELESGSDFSNESQPETALAVLDDVSDADTNLWLTRVKDVVEEALLRQEQRIVAREGAIRVQSEKIVRLELERDHTATLRETEKSLSHETERRLKATNRNLRTALEERDRRLVVFARKLSKLRLDKDSRADSRVDLIEHLRQLHWYNWNQRRAILSTLEDIS